MTRHRVLMPLLVLALMVLGLPVSAGAMVQSLSCTIDGMQEVPASGSAGIGTGKFTIDTVANTLSYEISFSGLVGTETAAHIHGPAPPGVNAGVQHGLPAGSPKIGVWDYPQSMEANILSGLMYVNIHSTMFPGGEIRGQIVKSKIVRYAATIDGAQEVPPSGSPGTGSGTFLVDTTANTLSYEISFSGLVGSETVAHIHGPAPPGANAGVQHGLPAGSPKIGVWNYPQSTEANILSGLMYVNIHSSMFPGGEIRGQIIEDCGQGTVNTGGGGPEEVLTVNGSAGLPGCRTVTVPVSTSITVDLASSGAGPVNGRYVIYTWACPPQNPVNLTAGMATLGSFGNPTPLQGGFPQPFRCVRGTGLPNAVCAGVSTINGPPRTPVSLTKASGFGSPITATMQALIEDSGANAFDFSTSNYVVLVVE